MKILLMIPINRTYVIMPSLGLGYLASSVRKNGHDVKILHCAKENFDYDNFRDYITENSFDMIGIQMFTYDFNSVKKHLKIIKESGIDAITVVGGYHTSGDPAGSLQQLKDADFAFYGECEIGFTRFADELEKTIENGKEGKRKEKMPGKEILRKIPNLIWRDNGSINVNEWKFVDDLDSLDFPAWDLMDPRTYPEAPHGAFFKSFPCAPIIITRGCPYQCTFCAGKCITSNKVRKRSIKNVIAEIEWLMKNYGVNEFLIEDENFTLHKELVNEFCRTVITKSLKINWSCPSGVRLDTLDDGMLELMEKSGCHSLSVGVEFGSQRILDSTKKSLTVEKIREKVALFKKRKIKVTGFFMMGYPGETKDDIKATIKLAQQLDINRAQFNNFMPLPGSEIYNILRDRGELNDINYDHFFVHDVGYVPNGLTKKDMKRFQREAYIRFYLRPKIMLNLLKEVKDVYHLRKLVQRFLDGLR